MQHEAYRKFARDHSTAIIFGPFIARAVSLAVVVLALMAAWIYIPHRTLGTAALILAGGLAVVYLAVNGSRNNVQARMMARAKGQPVKSGLGLGWAVASVVVMLGGLGWLSLWSQWA